MCRGRHIVLGYVFGFLVRYLTTLPQTRQRNVLSCSPLNFTSLVSLGWSQFMDVGSGLIGSPHTCLELLSSRVARGGAVVDETGLVVTISRPQMRHLQNVLSGNRLYFQIGISFGCLQ